MKCIHRVYCFTRRSNGNNIKIDIQKEYSNSGRLIIENYEEVVNNLLKQVSKYDKVILIKHGNNEDFFTNKYAQIDERLSNNDYLIIENKSADAFDNTNLKEELDKYKNLKLAICGIMMPNCITYTALSVKQFGYDIEVIEELYATIDIRVHKIIINALKSKDIKVV